MKDKMHNENIEDDEISIKQILENFSKWFAYIRSKWLIITCFVILGSTLGFFYAKTKKAVYTATTTFVLEEGENGGGLSQYAGLASMAGIDLGSGGGGIFQGDNILQLYKSRKMIMRALFAPVVYDGKKKLLVNQYIEFNRLRETWKDLRLKSIVFSSDSVPQSNTRLRDSLLLSFINDISVNYLSVSKPDKKESLISAQVKSKDEFFAKNFNEQIVKTVNDFYIQTKIKKSLANISILEKKSDSIKAVLNGAIYAASAVADATPNLNVTRQTQRNVPLQRSQFTAETNKAIFSELVKNLEISKISLLKETPLIEIVDGPIYPLEKNKLGILKGTAIGGIIGGVLICIYLILKRIFKGII